MGICTLGDALVDIPKYPSCGHTIVNNVIMNDGKCVVIYRVKHNKAKRRRYLASYLASSSSARTTSIFFFTGKNSKQEESELTHQVPREFGSLPSAPMHAGLL